MAANVVTIGASVFTGASSGVFRRVQARCNASGNQHGAIPARPQVGMGAGGNRKFLGQRRGDALVAPATGRRAILLISIAGAALSYSLVAVATTLPTLLFSRVV